MIDLTKHLGALHLYLHIHTSHLLLYAIWIQLSQTVVSSANEIQIKVKSKVRFFLKRVFATKGPPYDFYC